MQEVTYWMMRRQRTIKFSRPPSQLRSKLKHNIKAPMKWQQLSNQIAKIIHVSQHEARLCSLCTPVCLDLTVLFSCGFGQSNISNRNNMIQCIGEEREALLQFKQGIQHGIRCENRTNHVIRLDLHAGNFGCVEGKISPSFPRLKHLKYLDLSFNFLESFTVIPSFIGSFRGLKYLNLSRTGFQGEIPHQLANLSSLTSLDLSASGDLYVGTLGWLSHLTSLRDINLSWVNLSQATDWMQVVSKLPFLTNLQMYGCSLSPSIPSSVVYTNTSVDLHLLNFADNKLNDSRMFQGCSTSLHSVLTLNTLTSHPMRLLALFLVL
ncbi:hypothetical protein Cgig2_007877 [Carnegiea gigantea]|uniref:Uncharacterized protein n=1 Tax=Carnegiea gigantea TaxID=171969 RepID=A0A9Q1KEK0_9CARY|nr:hypothetical protein Cgig2_007877 [Carnegiea gigantea]